MPLHHTGGLQAQRTEWFAVVMGPSSMRHDDIITKIVGPKYHLVWPAFLKASCFLSTSCFPIQKDFPFRLLICKGSRAQCQEPFPSAAIPTPLWCRSEEVSSVHNLPVSAGQLIQRIPLIQPKSIEGEGCMQTHFSNPFLHAPLSPRPIWRPLPPLCLQAIQMASREGGMGRGSKTKWHFAASEVSWGW